MSTNASQTIAAQVAVDVVKKRKNIEKVDVTIVERIQQDWIIRGTVPIDMEGHSWAERFEVVVDPKGRVKSVDFALL